MKKILILVLAIAISVAFYEQASTDKNTYIMVIAIVIFMMGLRKLSSKIPSKNQNKERNDVE